MSQEAAIALQSVSCFSFLCPTTPFILDPATPHCLGHLIFFLVSGYYDLFSFGLHLGVNNSPSSPLGFWHI